MKLKSQIAVVARSEADAMAEFQVALALVSKKMTASIPMSYAHGSGYRAPEPFQAWTYGTVLRPLAPRLDLPVDDDRMLFLGFATQRPGFYGVVLRSEDPGREHEPPAIYSVRNWEPADEA